ncbi:hypothetical protein [Deinococcus sp. 6GRE01]|uniref:hypothetical protein n=1 Tax=Deinococcus sp. 6GRE01 TaxID=2745873 RepID=UPI001E639016|nr:hypothetical protein [Deinococcus sp. 6GRE01]
MNHHDLANAAQLAELQEWVAAAVGAARPQPVGQGENAPRSEAGVDDPVPERPSTENPQASGISSGCDE